MAEHEERLVHRFEAEQALRRCERFLEYVRGRACRLPKHGQITNFCRTLVYVCHRRIRKDNRYCLSTDDFIPGQKDNPISQALRIKALKDKNPGLSNSQIARRLGTSRARVTQMLNLLKLAPEIQEVILSSKDADKAFTERQLRPLTYIQDLGEQRKLFRNVS